MGVLRVRVFCHESCDGHGGRRGKTRREDREMMRLNEDRLHFGRWSCCMHNQELHKWWQH